MALNSWPSGRSALILLGQISPRAMRQRGVQGAVGDRAREISSIRLSSRVKFIPDYNLPTGDQHKDGDLTRRLIGDGLMVHNLETVRTDLHFSHELMQERVFTLLLMFMYSPVYKPSTIPIIFLDLHRLRPRLEKWPSKCLRKLSGQTIMLSNPE